MRDFLDDLGALVSAGLMAGAIAALAFIFGG